MVDNNKPIKVGCAQSVVIMYDNYVRYDFGAAFDKAGDQLEGTIHTAGTL